jgi:CHAT domain-containing protein
MWPRGRLTSVLAPGLAGLLFAMAALGVGCQRSWSVLDTRRALSRAAGRDAFAGVRFAGLAWNVDGIAPARRDRALLRAVAIQMERQRAASPAEAAWQVANRGLIELIAGRLDAAETLFRRAAALGAAGDPGPRIDLCGFFLARAGRAEDAKPADPLRALTACDDALALRPASLEALYDKALALEALYLWHEAALTWTRYLRLDRTSEWTRGARLHLEGARRALAASTGQGRPEVCLLATASSAGRGGNPQAAVDQIVAAHHDVARLCGLETLLGRWSAARDSGREEEASAVLATARRIGFALRRDGGDALLIDSVSAIDAAAGEPVRLGALVRGHRLFAAALAQERDESFAAAMPLFAASGNVLARADSPFAGLATLHLGVCQYYSARYAEALASLAAFAQPSAAAAYPAEAAYGLWMSGLVRFVTADRNHALAEHLRALALFTSQREPPHVAFAAALVAGDLYSLGRREESWAYRRRSLAGLAQLHEAHRVYSVLMAAAEAAFGDQQPGPALDFTSELIDFLDPAASPGLLAEAFARRAVIGAAAAMTPALADIASARAQQAQVADPVHGPRVAADIDLAEGEILLLHDPARAIGRLLAARAYFQRAGFRANSGQALWILAAAYRASGRPDLAARSLDEAIDEHEAGRRDLQGDAARIAYFAQAQPFFDEMIRLQAVELGNPLAALLYAERSRAQSLLDHIRALDPRAGRPLESVAALTAGLPAATSMVEIAVLAKQSFAWTVSRERVSLLPLPYGSDDLAAAARRLREELQAGGDARATARDLYSRLIAPLRPSLRGAKAVVFVPDGPLDEVPFAALQDPATGRRLIEDFTVSVSPSAALYLRSLGSRPPLPPPSDRALLLVEGDAFDRAAGPALAPLSNTGAEARALAALYRRTTVLAGPTATKEKVLAAFRSSEVAQLTAHALADPRSPGAAAIILAPSRAGLRDAAASTRSAPGDLGSLLGSRDLEDLVLRRLRLVVLAACGTAAGGAPNREGSLSLARGFLVAGVPAVVAALWSIDDRDSASFLRLFHQHLAAGAAPAAALRAAQLAFLHQPPLTWAAFELVGTVASSPGPAAPTTSF